LRAFYFAFGDPDVYSVVDLPDNESATAVAFDGQRVGAEGPHDGARGAREVNAAAKRSIDYRPPRA
jgi:hypothetical protein